ncbi:MAG TPA: hypothetical protein VFA98_00735 [Thermoanaerobaculia bacterium]|nr:hypothetical protein [Thermoanaerobaculia bacterium]
MSRRFLRRRRLGVAVFVSLVSICLARPLSACSMCRCSDPVFSALGEGLYSYGGFQVALDWNRLNQTEGAGGTPDFEAQVRNTLTATIAYGWQDRLTVVAQVPYTFNDLTTSDGIETADAVGDPSFYVTVRLWSSRFSQGLGKRAWIAALVGVKTPWGNNNVTENGVRLDEHVQPGTGATNLTGGLNGLYLLDAESSIYASVAYTGTGRNDFGYKYGNNVQANLVYDRKLTDFLDGLLEVNFLDAKHDQVNASGLIDPNTGGQSLYLTPRVGVHVVHGLVVRAAAQFPVWKNLNGIQDIKPAYTAGLTYVF